MGLRSRRPEGGCDRSIRSRPAWRLQAIPPGTIGSGPIRFLATSAGGVRGATAGNRTGRTTYAPTKSWQAHPA
jgi:hypothetical protein